MCKKVPWVSFSYSPAVSAYWFFLSVTFLLSHFLTPWNQNAVTHCRIHNFTNFVPRLSLATCSIHDFGSVQASKVHERWHTRADGDCSFPLPSAWLQLTKITLFAWKTYLMKQSHVRNNIETLLSPLHHKIDDTVTRVNKDAFFICTQSRWLIKRELSCIFDMSDENGAK